MDIELELIGRQDVTFFHPTRPNRYGEGGGSSITCSTLVVSYCLRGCLFLTKFMMFDYSRISTQFKSKITINQ